jgi:hypothetical protein
MAKKPKPAPPRKLGVKLQLGPTPSVPGSRLKGTLPKGKK